MEKLNIKINRTKKHIKIFLNNKTFEIYPLDYNFYESDILFHLFGEIENILIKIDN